MYFNRDDIRAGIYGVIVGDALGVPAEFQKREELEIDPIVDMVGGGTYNKPKGTFSDDSSMTLACLYAMSKKDYTYDDIMIEFLKWLREGKFTPDNEVFDVGNRTYQSLVEYEKNRDINTCGGRGIRDNGNGSLMRILPVIFDERFNKDEITKRDVNHIEMISSLTHAHPISRISVTYYAYLAVNIIKKRNLSKEELVFKTIDIVEKYYKYDNQLLKFLNINSLKDALNIETNDLKSGGFVVDTLVTSIYLFLNSTSYENVLDAVNLGKDTDTTAAVLGGLLGLYYGYESIKKSWIEKIRNKKMIDGIIDKFNI